VLQHFAAFYEGYDNARKFVEAFSGMKIFSLESNPMYVRELQRQRCKNLQRPCM
jgi:hypothetical protein